MTTLTNILQINFKDSSDEEKKAAIKMYNLIIDKINLGLNIDKPIKKKCQICLEEVEHPYSKAHINSTRHKNFVYNNIKSIMKK